MSQPVLWPKPLYFYPVGNSPAVDLTRGLAYENDATILLLGCGDARNILYTLHAGLAASRNDFSMDITCCDIQPGVLARNVLILTLMADGQISDEHLWNITYHFKIDNDSLAAIRAQSKKLAQFSSSLSEWDQCEYGRWVRFSSSHTLQELHRYWDIYQAPLSRTDEARVKKEIINRRANQSYALWNLARSAGPYAPAAMTFFDDHFHRCWDTGVVDLEPSAVQKATNLNPTFFHSLLGLGVHFDYQTYPLVGFHLGKDFADSPGQAHISTVIETAKRQYRLWREAFIQKIHDSNSLIVLRPHVGDALVFSHALRAYSLDHPPPIPSPVTPWSSTLIQLDGSDYAKGALLPAPRSFNVIDTSNLFDHAKAINLLIACSPLLELSPSATMYTESFFSHDTGLENLTASLCMDVDIAAAIFGIVPTPYASGFSSYSSVASVLVARLTETTLGVGTNQLQHHERMSWKHTSFGLDSAPLPFYTVYHPMFTPDDLAKIVFNAYQKMASQERLLIGSPDSLRRRMNAAESRPTTSSSATDNILRLHRGTAVALLGLVKRRQLTDNWDRCIRTFLDLYIGSNDQLMLAGNYFQELCCLLYVHGIYHAVERLRPRTGPIDLHRRGGVFDGWKEAPVAICVVLLVPRRALKVIESDRRPDGIERSPTLQLSVFSTIGTHNMHSSISCAWGHVTIENTGEHKIVHIHETLDGFSASADSESDLIVSAWVPTWTLVAHGAPATSIALTLVPSLGTLHLGRGVLGPSLTLFKANILDAKSVHLVKRAPQAVGTPYVKTSLPTLLHSYTPTTRPCALLTLKPGTDSASLQNLSARCVLSDPIEKQALLEGGLSGVPEQTSLSSVRVRFGKFEQTMVFPIPVSAVRTKVARKSGYVEITVSPSRPSSSTVAGDVSADLHKVSPWAFSSLNETRTPTSWSMHHLRMDHLPVFNYHGEIATRHSWQNTHCEYAFSPRERAHISIHPPSKTDGVLLAVKRAIHAIFASLNGQDDAPADFFTLLRAGDSKPFCLIFPNSLRLDAASNAIVAECFVIPLETKDALVSEQLIGHLTGVGTRIQPADNLRTVLPLFVERCRTWKHKTDCTYSSPGKNSNDAAATAFLCDCGAGIESSYAQCFKKGSRRHLAPYATRAAISHLFNPSYIEPIKVQLKGSWVAKQAAGQMGPTASSSSVADECHRCKKRSGKVLRCGRCKAVSYCGKECQKEDWSGHKRVCGK